MMIVSLVLGITSLFLLKKPTRGTFDETVMKSKISVAISGAAFLLAVPSMQCAANTFCLTRTQYKGSVGFCFLAWLCYIPVNIFTATIIMTPYRDFNLGWIIASTVGSTFTWICIFIHAESQRKYSYIPILSNSDPVFPISLPMGNNEPNYKPEVQRKKKRPNKQ